MDSLLRLGLSNAAAAMLLALLAALVSAGIRRRRPAVVHALWLLVLLKLLTPPLWTVPVAIPLAFGARGPLAETEASAAALPFKEVEVLSADDFEFVIDAPPGAAPVGSAASVTWAWFPRAVAILWLAGSLTCFALVIVRSWRFARLLRHAAPAPPPLAQRVAHLASRLGLRRPPGVWLVPGAVCPMLWAVLRRPRLLLPETLWAKLGEAERDSLLAHELAHLRRRDHWVRLVEVAATVLYWWHPAAWWARRELREAEEQCCDAWVVWSIPRCARHYMNAILKAVDSLSDAAGPLAGARLPAVPPVASGMASGQFRHLERRLSMIRQNENSGRTGAARTLGRAGLVAVCAGALGLLPLAPSLAQQSVQIEAAPQAEGEPGREGRLFLTTEVAAEPAPEGKILELTAPERHVVVQLAPGGAPQAEPKGLVTVTPREVEYTPVTVEFSPAGSEVERARMDVERLTAELQAAKARLKSLEAGEGSDDPKPKPKLKARLLQSTVKKGNGAPATSYLSKVTPRTVSVRDQDPQRRLDEMEQKLDRLLNELHDLKQQRQDGGSGAASSPNVN